jgi:2-polyprenyl-3-methyl-5-hydroxy-6-metoxy-1,4-benzoquinol methylase
MENTKNIQKLLNERVNCPACNYKDSNEIIKLEWDHEILTKLFKNRNYPLNFIKEGSYLLLECIKCSLIYQKYSPNDDLLDMIYNKWIQNRNNEVYNKKNYNFNPFYANKTIYNISEISQLLNILPPKPYKHKVLDFGMGWGGWCNAAKLMGLEVYGMEITNSQIQYNKAHGLKVISWDEISGLDFDFINIEQVFEHVDKPFLLLKQLLSGLSAEGFVKISVPNASNVKSNLKKDFKTEWFFSKGKKCSLNSVEPLQHLNGFNYRSLITMSSQLGLQEVNRPIGNFQKNSVGVYTYTNFVKFSTSTIYRHLKRRQSTNLLFKKVHE